MRSTRGLGLGLGLGVRGRGRVVARLDDAEHEHVGAAERGEEEGLQRDHLVRVRVRVRARVRGRGRVRGSAARRKDCRVTWHRTRGGGTVGGGYAGCEGSCSCL